MAGVRPLEGRTFSGNFLIKNISTDRGTNLTLSLITNATVDENLTAAYQDLALRIRECLLLCSRLFVPAHPCFLIYCVTE